MQSLLTLISQYQRFAKFLVTGVIMTVVNLGLLYLCTDIIGLWYMVSLYVSFAITVILNFIVQKYWTFHDAPRHSTGRRFGLFVLNAIVYLALNSLVLYLLVEYVHMWYLLAQAITIGILMIMNYTFYRLIIFKPDRVA